MQIVYRGVPGAPTADYVDVLGVSNSNAKVFVTRSAVPDVSTDAYMVQGASQSAEVRVWNPTQGPIPTSAEMSPLLRGIAETIR